MSPIQTGKLTYLATITSLFLAGAAQAATVQDGAMSVAHIQSLLTSSKVSEIATGKVYLQGVIEGILDTSLGLTARSGCNEILAKMTLGDLTERVSKSFLYGASTSEPASRSRMEAAYLVSLSLGAICERETPKVP